MPMTQQSKYIFLSSTVNSIVSTINNNLALKANSADVTTSLNTKQNAVIQNANAAGVPIIDASSNVRRKFAEDGPLDANLYVDPITPSNPKNNQIQLSIDLSNYVTNAELTTAVANWSRSIHDTLFSAYALTSYVNAAISILLDGVPTSMNTLAQIANSVGSDPELFYQP